MRDHRHPLVELTLARLREFAREPAAVFWVFAFPLLLAVALGVAFRNKPPEPVRIAVADADCNAALISRLQTRNVVVDCLPAQEARDAVDRGKVDLLLQPSAAEVGYVYDAMRAESRLARAVVESALVGAVDANGAAHVNRPITEKGRRYVDFLLPGLIGMNLLGSSMWGTGWVIVDARKRKLLKRLAATPMRRSHYLVSLLLARLVFLVAEVGFLMAAGRLLFGVETQGSLLSVFVLSFIGAASFTGLALLIAARPATTEAASGLFNTAQMPMWLLSGTFFSAERFPEWLQPLVQALPLTALNDALRAVINDGATLASQAGEVGIMAAWGVLPIGLAVRMFRWQ